MLALSKTGLFRLTTDGKNMGKLYDDPTQSVCLYGNYLYYQHYDEKKGLQLNAAKMDGSSDELLLDEGVSPYSISQGVMYYTGYDPRTMEKVYTPVSHHEKEMQRALIQYKKPENYDLVKEALLANNRNDLIGFGPKCLIPPRKIRSRSNEKSRKR